MAHIYLDNAATTRMASAVIDVMQTAMTNTFGNASTPNFYGHAAKATLEQSRHLIAQSINAHDEEIIFTSGGSEGDNTALITTALSRQKQGHHIISTTIEHEAVLKTLQFLESLGFEVTYLPVNDQGQIEIADLKAALRPDTILVSVMMVNNEIGTINPIAQIGALLKDYPVVFHTDAVQAYGLLDIDVQALQVDLLTTSAHKLNGPKMMGFMYERQGLNLPAFIHGGDQENKRRAGTENVPAIAGFAESVKLHDPTMKSQTRQRLQQYKSLLLGTLKQAGVQFQINGPQDISQAAPHILNIRIANVATDLLQMKLDLAGFIVSGGSACTAGSLEPSHVLQALYSPSDPRIQESIRISFDTYTTQDEVQQFAQALQEIAVNQQKG